MNIARPTMQNVQEQHLLSKLLVYNGAHELEVLYTFKEEEEGRKETKENETIIFWKPRNFFRMFV